MNTELYIARRVFTQQNGNKGTSNRIVSIAVASISIGLAIMIVSISVLFGFKKQIREKVIGFASHFQIVNYDANYSYETAPIVVDSFMVSLFQTVPHFKSLNLFATKPGIIKTDEAIHPLVFKGVCDRFDWGFFAQSLVEGRLPDPLSEPGPLEVLVSEKQAKLLRLPVGGKVYCYFYNEGDSNPRGRRFDIVGIYKTSLAEFDDVFVIGDIRQVQQLSGWATNQVSGYEITVDDYKFLSDVDDRLKQMVMNHASERVMLKVMSVERKYSLLFDWLSILDMNVWVLLVLVLVVAGINMTSGLLIIILERSRMIGTLKALGFPNFSIRKLFLYLTGLLSLRGMVWGNLIGIGLCVFQYYTGFIKLDPATYYIETVPVDLVFVPILLVNIGTLIGIVLMVLLPSMYISKISPVEAMRIE